MNNNRILLIEDDNWFATSLKHTISNQLIGADIIVENDPRRAIDLIDSLEPTVIIADIHLGPTNFLTLLNELVSYPDTLKLPKIILSSSGESLNINDLTEYGITAIYDKRTFQMTDFMATLQGVLNGT